MILPKEPMAKRAARPVKQDGYGYPFNAKVQEVFAPTQELRNMWGDKVVAPVPTDHVPTGFNFGGVWKDTTLE